MKPWLDIELANYHKINCLHLVICRHCKDQHSDPPFLFEKRVKAGKRIGPNS